MKFFGKIFGKNEWMLEQEKEKQDAEIMKKERQEFLKKSKELEIEQIKQIKEDIKGLKLNGELTSYNLKYGMFFEFINPSAVQIEGFRVLVNKLYAFYMATPYNGFLRIEFLEVYEGKFRFGVKVHNARLEFINDLIECLRKMEI